MKNIVTDRYLEGQSLSASFTGGALDCGSLHAPFIQVIVTNAAALNGALTVEGTSDINPGTGKPTNWVAITEFAAKTLTGDGISYWQLFASTLTPKFIRLVYARTGGTANLTAIVSGVKI